MKILVAVKQVADYNDTAGRGGSAEGTAPKVGQTELTSALG